MTCAPKARMLVGTPKKRYPYFGRLSFPARAATASRPINSTTPIPFTFMHVHLSTRVCGCLSKSHEKLLEVFVLLNSRAGLLLGAHLDASASRLQAQQKSREKSSLSTLRGINGSAPFQRSLRASLG